MKYIIYNADPACTSFGYEGSTQLEATTTCPRAFLMGNNGFRTRSRYYMVHQCLVVKTDEASRQSTGAAPEHPVSGLYGEGSLVVLVVYRGRYTDGKRVTTDTTLIPGYYYLRGITVLSSVLCPAVLSLPLPLYYTSHRGMTRTAEVVGASLSTQPRSRLA